MDACGRMLSTEMKNRGALLAVPPGLSLLGKIPYFLFLLPIAHAHMQHVVLQVDVDV